MTWALRLEATLHRLSKAEGQRRRKLKELRRELDKKNKALNYYKARIVELENEVEGYTSSMLVQFAMNLKNPLSIFVRKNDKR